MSIGYGHLAVPDSVKAFTTNVAFANSALAAIAPNGYNTAWVNMGASFQEPNGYLGYIAIDSYNTTRCAVHCGKTSGCNSFNICTCINISCRTIC